MLGLGTIKSKHFFVALHSDRESLQMGLVREVVWEVYQVLH